MGRYLPSGAGGAGGVGGGFGARRAPRALHSVLVRLAVDTFAAGAAELSPLLRSHERAGPTAQLSLLASPFRLGYGARLGELGLSATRHGRIMGWGTEQARREISILLALTNANVIKGRSPRSCRVRPAHDWAR